MRGLDAGGDDYLVKPFALAELFARLRALTRREPVERPTVLRVGDLELDPAGRRVTRAGVVIDLSPTEFSLLEQFMRTPDTVLTRTILLEKVWDFAYDGTSNVVDVYVRYLREKVDRPSAHRVSRPCAAWATSCDRRTPRCCPAASRCPAPADRPRADPMGIAPRTLRARLAAISSAVAAIAIASGSTATYVLGKQQLVGNLDRSLEDRAGKVVRSIEANGRVPADEPFVQVVSSNGVFVTSTAVGSDTSLLTLEQIRFGFSAEFFVDRDIEPIGRARLLATPADIGDRRYVVIVGTSRQELEDNIIRLRLGLALGAPLLAAAVGFGVWLVVGATLRPVKRMTDEAAVISGANLDRRLAVPPGNDELAHLGTTLNAMLGRIEDSFRRERSFVDDASHELRTPLAIMRGEIELALAGDPPEAERATLESLREEVERLATLAEDLLVLARVDSARAAVGDTDVCAATHEIVGRLGPTLRHPVTVVVSAARRRHGSARRRWSASSRTSSPTPTGTRPTASRSPSPRTCGGRRAPRRRAGRGRRRTRLPHPVPRPRLRALRRAGPVEGQVALGHRPGPGDRAGAGEGGRWIGDGRQPRRRPDGRHRHGPPAPRRSCRRHPTRARGAPGRRPVRAHPHDPAGPRRVRSAVDRTPPRRDRRHGGGSCTRRARRSRRSRGARTGPRAGPEPRRADLICPDSS